MTAVLQFQPARKEKLKARMAVGGVSGGGKTETALRIMRGLVGPQGRIAVIDTEHESAKLYADRHTFDHLSLTDYHPDRYIEAIHAARDARYDGLIIDSLSHAWSSSTGALAIVDRIAKKSQSQNSYFAWREVTPLHNKLVDTMLALRSHMHLIVTVRSKTAYVIDEKNGKSVPRKVGMESVQRDGLEYEFDIFGDMTIDHDMIVSKTRWSDVDGEVFAKPTEEFGVRLARWLDDGAEREPAPSRPALVKNAPEPDSREIPHTDTKRTLGLACAVRVQGKPLGEVRNTGLRAMHEWALKQMDEKGEDARLQQIAEACTMILAAREAGELEEPAKKEKPAKAAKAEKGDYSVGELPGGI